ncbi:hypothetical protein JYU04_02580, partial [Dehalococcoides mccartyi]|nr:hypothetical protein [Dehalococcoides mccartyi]
SIDLVHASPFTQVIDRQITLESMVVLRPITEEECWEYGDEHMRAMNSTLDSPQTNSSVLQIEVEHKLDHPTPLLPVVKRSVMSSLTLLGHSGFHVIPVKSRHAFGIYKNNALEHIQEAHLIRGGFNVTLEPKSISDEEVKVLEQTYPVVKGVVGDPKSYLNLSLTRLVDGCARGRHDDAILDLVIGLENLLLGGDSSDLAYRFRMTGAYLAGDGLVERREWVGRLKELYKVRSKIVHGGRARADEFLAHRKTAEQALRVVWLHFAQSGKKNQQDVIKSVESSWLNSSC